VLFGSVSSADEVWTSYLAEADGDSTQARVLMGNDIRLLSGEVLALERDLKVERAQTERFKKLYGIERGNWLEQVWDSDLMRWVTFVFGVWLGTQASNW
jgi:hypothetical protein